MLTKRWCLMLSIGHLCAITHRLSTAFFISKGRDGERVYAGRKAQHRQPVYHNAMELDIWQLTTLVRSTAEEAVRQYRIAIDPSSDEITQREAARIYGVGWLKSQCARGMITWSRAGTAPNSKKIFSRKRLEELKNGDIDPILKKAFGRK